MSKLFPVQIENSSRRVGEYFWGHPNEKNEDIFNRAKKQTIVVIRDVLDGVERLEFCDFECQLKRGLMKRVESTNFWPDVQALNGDLINALRDLRDAVQFTPLGVRGIEAVTQANSILAKAAP